MCTYKIVECVPLKMDVVLSMLTFPQKEKEIKEKEKNNM